MAHLMVDNSVKEFCPVGVGETRVCPVCRAGDPPIYMGSALLPNKRFRYYRCPRCGSDWTHLCCGGDHFVCVDSRG